MDISISKFKEELIRQDKSDNTVMNYINALLFYVEYIEGKAGSFSPGEILEMDIKEFKSFLLNIKKEKPSTINLRLTALSKYCEFLIDQDILKKNPIKTIGKVKQQARNTSPKTLSKSNLYRLKREFYKTENIRDIAIYELLYNTGVRVSELCDIETGDIDISERKGSLIIREGKGKKYRTIPLNSDVRKAVTDYMAILPSTTKKNQKLLSGQRGNLKRQAINKILNKYASRAGLEAEKVHPHVLRHQLGRDLIRNGTDIVSVAEILGHADINITRIYSLPTEEEKANELERLQEENTQTTSTRL